MQSITRTCYGASLQTAQYLKLPLIIKPNSTLNEKFNIHADVALADTDTPSVKYVGIGNGGHRIIMGTNNIAKPEPIQHRARDAACYNQLPFVLRLPNEDLTTLERSQYRLRRLETHDGTLYVAYYLKVLDLTSVVGQTELRTVIDGVTTSTEFTPTANDLNPTPPAITPGGTITTTGDYIAATAKVPFTLTADDVVELLNVCNVIYGDPNYAFISELAICSGIDKTLMGDFNGVSSSYTDAIAVQITTHVSLMFPANFNNNGLTMLLDLGILESMLNLI